MNTLVAIIMGSKSDWETMEHDTKTLDELKIPYEAGEYPVDGRLMKNVKNEGVIS